MPGRLEFDVNFSTATAGKRRRSPSSPMRILLMGDFSGENHGGPEIPIRRVDLDNFENTLAKLAPRLTIVIGKEPASTIELEFSRLEDFHPDGLFASLPLFNSLRTLRENLRNPATFAQAAAQLAIPDSATAPTTGQAQEPGDAAAAPGASLLDELIGTKAAHIAPQPTALGSGKTVDISAFMKNAVAPYIQSGPHPRRDEYIAGVDLAIGQLMREILHNPRFQALEATWRGAHECLSRLELDESLQLYLLNVSKERLQQDVLLAGDDLQNSLLYRSVVDETVRTAGGEPWSLIAGMYAFSQQESDIQNLKALGRIAHDAGGPFVAAAGGGLIGCGSLAISNDPRQWQALTTDEQTAWDALRGYPYANWLGLVFPRFLLRLPYGAKAQYIESFAFEEIPSGGPEAPMSETPISEAKRHECYLWGNGAIAAAVLIAQSFRQSGWSMRLGEVLELDDLPWHVYESQGEKTVKPCAEAFLSERAAERIENYGVMPLMSYKDRNVVRLWRFRSLALPDANLSGIWEE